MIGVRFLAAATLVLSSMFCCSRVLAEDANDALSDELKSETHQAVVAEFKKILDQHAAITRRTEPPITAELVPEPILNWDDLARGHHHGTLWVWGKVGRPAAIIEMYTTSFSKKIEGWPGNVVHSLCQDPLTAAGTRPWNWAPDEPGFRPERLADAPEPGSTKSTRRLQMRMMAKRFTSNETLFGNRTELRLLNTPVYLYESPEDKILDGGLFVFVHGGTNPEVVLILEAMEINDKRFWQFGCARLGHASARVNFDERVVWNVETYSQFDPKSPYYAISK